MTTASHWLAIQFDDDGKVLDVAPFGGYQRASLFALSNGRAKDGWTVRQVPEGTTAGSAFGEELPPAEPRKVTKPAPTVGAFAPPPPKKPSAAKVR